MNLDTMPGKKIINLIFEPGFSSKKETTEISGRGVGMNDVKNEIEKIGGQIKVMNRVDVGTTFEINLPLFR
ncbi:MAG: ATP-binding protein [Bdellovibrionota bacterium]|nr:ATP-binding protein [Bdellovibrionota bacterium]MEC8624918.1 ATP-binding protein [Bdellovibrionota bacterium]